MKVLTLLENTKDQGTSLIAKHGLSLYIETEKFKILFDVGPDDSFLYNAGELGIDLSEVNTLVLSHAHNDHCGGLGDFLKINNQGQVFLRTGAQGEFFSLRDGEYVYIGLDPEVVETYRDRLNYISEKTEISPGITLIPPAQYGTFVPKSFLYQIKDGVLVKDSLEHELIMVIEEREESKEGRLHVFTGCSHNGIINMILTVEKEFPNTKIQTLTGGFHLMNPRIGKMVEEEETVKGIAEKLQEHYISRIYTGHCTGAEAFEVLQGILGEKIRSISTGNTFDLVEQPTTVKGFLCR